MSVNPYALAELHSATVGKKLNHEGDVGHLVAAMLLQVVHCKWKPDEEQQQKLLDTLAHRACADRDQADELLGAASFLLHFYVADGFGRLLKQSKARFSSGQKKAVIELMEELARVDGPPNTRQRKLIEQTIQTLR